MLVHQMSNSLRGRRSKVGNEAKEKEQGTSVTASDAAKQLGRLGGKARLHKLTSDDRRRIAQKAAAARWKK
jgi:hypothetical protein